VVLLNKEQIQYLLNELSYETVVEPNEEFRYRVQREKIIGYRKGIPGTIQAALSIALEVEQKHFERLSRKEGPA